VTIATVVEGHGEVEALPVLLRRIVADIAPGLYIDVPRPYRAGRHALVRPGVLEDVVRTQGDRVASAGGVLVAREQSPSFDKVWRDVKRLISD
jgi:hypothetical protein